MLWLLSRRLCSDMARRPDPTLVRRAALDIAFLLTVPFLFDFMELSQSVSVLLLLLCAFLVSITDLSVRKIPDRLTITGIIVGLGLSLLWTEVSFVQSLAGATVLPLVVLALSLLVGRASGHGDTLGGGDVKLIAMVGSFLGWYAGAWAVTLAAAGTLVIVVAFRVAGRKMRRVPFGPGIAWASVVVFQVPLNLESVGTWVAVDATLADLTRITY